jgi:alkanesulfonate monooxygenase SsuD/methylene tetrahydromethanopterin reductase-like flavin-dependent oxidoreductase (luciferase family)
MQIGIGLPITIPGVNGKLALDWARKAEANGFSSLGTLDRLVYGNYDSLISLAAAAAVTERVRLITTILIAPLHNPAGLAKQTATLDALSNGRLTLGLAVGGREDDYKAAGIPFKQRGKIFDQQLELMQRVWAGEPVSEEVGPIGPRPVQQGGPEILIGAYSPTAIERVGKWGNGFIVGGGGPQMAAQSYKNAEAAWQAAGRPGKPRFVAGFYAGIGPKDQAGAYLRDYYGFMPQLAEQIADNVANTPEALKGAIQAYEAVGLDELILWPTIAELDQVDKLAEIAHS